MPIFAQPTHRAWVLEALIPQLAKHGQPEKALRLVQALPDAPGPHGLNLRADALAHLASYLAPNLVTEALPVVHTIRDDWSRLHALVWFGPKLVQLGALDEALSAAHAYIKRMHWGTLWHSEGQRFVLLDLVSELPPALQGKVLSEALESARAIEGYGYRAEAITKLLPVLTELPAPLLFPLWSTTIHQLSQRWRTDLVADLHVLTPVIAALGGRSGLLATAQAITDVSNWFG